MKYHSVYNYFTHMGSSIKLSMLALLCGVALLTGVQAECQTTAVGFTWSYQADRDEILFDLPSAEACLSSCYDDPDCSGFTWQDDVVNICYKFQILEGQRTCHDCHSGTVPTIFSEEACNIDTSEPITFLTTNSSDSCYQACVGADGCVSYTWYNRLTTIPYYCFLYGKCSDVIPCLGCSSGILNCIGQSTTTSTNSPTTTTTTVTTSTTTNSPTTQTTTVTTSTSTVPLQCHEYKILDDPTRNEHHGYELYCDVDGRSYTSPDWQGEAYYRVQAPAGDKIPTSSPGYEHCGTYASGWINDEDGAIDQMEEGQEISVRACFAGSSNPCLWSNNITVTRCPGDFLVYHLVNTPSCRVRYCAN